MSTRDYKHAAERARREPKQPPRWPWFIGGFATGLLVAWGIYLHQYSPQTARLLASQSALRREAARETTPAAATASNTTGKTATGKEGNAGAKDKTAAGTPDKSHPRFEFYTLLPEMEVAVPEKELQAEAKKQEEQKQKQPAQTQAAAAPQATPTLKATAAPAAPVTEARVGTPTSTGTPARPDTAPPPQPAQAGSAQDSGNPVYMLQVASFRRAEDADRMKASLTLMGLEASIQTVSVNGTDTWYRVRVGPYTDIARLNDARARLHDNNLQSMVLKIRG
jgi:cell division protein FtsN